MIQSELAYRNIKAKQQQQKGKTEAVGLTTLGKT